MGSPRRPPMYQNPKASAFAIQLRKSVTPFVKFQISLLFLFHSPSPEHVPEWGRRLKLDSFVLQCPLWLGFEWERGYAGAHHSCCCLSMQYLDLAVVTQLEGREKEFGASELPQRCSLYDGVRRRVLSRPLQREHLLSLLWGAAHLLQAPP